MLKDLVLKNRSYRGYDRGVQIDEKTLLELVDMARLTASSVNQQPLRYHISHTPDDVAAVQALTRWARGLPELNLPYPGTEPTAFITICIDSPNPQAFLRDVGIAAQTILLGAAELGLGGCMIGNFSKQDARALLGLPESVEPNLIVALGKPAEEIVLTEAKKGESLKYYRGADGKTHYVPKLRLEDVLI